MRRCLISALLCIAITLPFASLARGGECEVIYIYRPDGQPPIEIEICPPSEGTQDHDNSGDSRRTIATNAPVGR